MLSRLAIHCYKSFSRVLNIHFSQFHTKSQLDRSISGCKLCDLSNAREQFELPKLPDDTYRNMARDTIDYITDRAGAIESVLSNGMNSEEIKNELVEWKRLKAGAFSDRSNFGNA